MPKNCSFFWACKCLIQRAWLHLNARLHPLHRRCEHALRVNAVHHCGHKLFRRRISLLHPQSASAMLSTSNDGLCLQFGERFLGSFIMFTISIVISSQTRQYRMHLVAFSNSVSIPIRNAVATKSTSFHSAHTIFPVTLQPPRQLYTPEIGGTRYRRSCSR